MDILTSKFVKTRKKHVCHGCANGYEKGTELNYYTSVDQGVFSSWYYCKTCEEVLYIGWVHVDLEDGIEVGDVRENDPDLWDNVNRKYR